jgi:hypothetical protein
VSESPKTSSQSSSLKNKEESLAFIEKVQRELKEENAKKPKKNKISYLLAVAAAGD